MTAYSLINALNGYFSVGIYTSLENVYCALRTVARACIKNGLSQENIAVSFKVNKVYLDAEPLKFHEFSTYGTDIEIDWEKVFKNC